MSPTAAPGTPAQHGWALLASSLPVEKTDEGGLQPQTSSVVLPRKQAVWNYPSSSCKKLWREKEQRGWGVGIRDNFLGDYLNQQISTVIALPWMMKRNKLAL